MILRVVGFFLLAGLALSCSKSKKDEEDDDSEGDAPNVSTNGGGGDGVDCKNATIKENVTLPVDLAASSDVYPFGIHGNTSNHPEGHPGLDFFYTSALPVKAPFNGTVSDTYSSGHETAMCITIEADDHCNTATYCGLDLTVSKGDAVNDGDSVGTIHLATGSDAGVDSSTLHISFNASTDAGFPLCSSLWLDPEVVRCVIGSEQGQTDPTDCSTVPLRDGGTLMKNWVGMPAGSRTVNCADGSQQTYDAPEENALCNGPLDAALRAEIYECVGLGDDRWN